MTNSYKILGQSVNKLEVRAPLNGSTILSELKIKNISGPTYADVFSTSDPLNSVQVESIPGSGPNNPETPLRLEVMLKDGSYLIKGSFSSFSNHSTRNFVKIKPDNTVDTSFSFPTFTGTVNKILELPDGSFYICGNFSNIGGTTRRGFAKLNANGTLNTSFPDLNIAKGGVVGNVIDFAVDQSGRVLLGGDFSSVAGNTRNFLAVVSSSGTLENSNPNPNGIVTRIEYVRSISSAIVRGGFTTIFGSSRTGLASIPSPFSSLGTLNPQLNTTSNLQFLVQKDNTILIWGDFTTAGGQSRSRIARFLATGLIDTSFSPVIQTTPERVHVNNGKILLVKRDSVISTPSFSSYTFLMLNQDGSIDTNFSYSSSQLPTIFLGDYVQLDHYNNIYTTTQLSSIPADFQSEYDPPSGSIIRIIKIKYDGTVDKSFIVPVPSSLLDMLLKNNTLYAGGFFDNILGISAPKFAILRLIPYTDEKNYLIKSKFLDYDEEISILGGVALSSGEYLLVTSSKPGGSKLIIQAYGIEETQ